MFNQKLYLIEKENTFSKSTRLVNEYRAAHPGCDIISLGIGDVSFPVCRPVTEAMEKACRELSSMDSFQGYGASCGIPSLRKAIAENDYAGLNLSPGEIYVGDGTKTDSTSILELFDIQSRILVGNPTYPIYRNGALALGRECFTGSCGSEYKMTVPSEHYDIIYICSPCNPTGNAYTRDELKAWISYANREKAFIIYDNVYKDFIESPDVPISIYELEGSRSCCIELRSYSKNVSFSGTRCSYMVLPKETGSELHELWEERTINRFNGASFIAQKGAEASYEPEARAIIQNRIRAYKNNAKYLKTELCALGFSVTGGIDSPYLWCSAPGRPECWDAFNMFLEKMNIIVVPGLIFGSAGKYNIRISSLGTLENSKKAIERIKKYYEKIL